jgi:uncharacterized protein involved in type VI secretion and phage assembly
MRFALAGPNWGSQFTPRIGTEVLVNFADGDMDRPVVLGQLYNGSDLPPFSAGLDSGINHAGVISGMHSQGMDGAGCNQWVLHDSTGQLHMRLASSTAASQLNLAQQLTLADAAGCQKQRDLAHCHKARQASEPEQRQGIRCTGEPTGKAQGGHTCQGRAPVSDHQAPVQLRQGTLSGIEEEHGPTGHTVCAFQLMDGAEQIMGGAGISAPANRQKA